VLLFGHGLAGHLAAKRARALRTAW
jgi:hypothetical protein